MDTKSQCSETFTEAHRSTHVKYAVVRNNYLEASRFLVHEFREQRGGFLVNRGAEPLRLLKDGFEQEGELVPRRELPDI